MDGSDGIEPYHRAMSPRSRRRSATRPRLHRTAVGRLLGLGFALLLAVGLVGCAAASFDPTGPCTADGSAAGAYPELEAAVPTSYQGAKATEVDSGRACSADGLGTLGSHGIKELRFAGATWQTGSQSGVSLALFSTAVGPALDPAWVTEFFETSARTTGKNVQSIDTTDAPVSPTVTGRRIDVLNGDSYQTIVIWEKDGQIAVALIGDFINEIQTKAAHEVNVQAAISTLAA